MEAEKFRVSIVDPDPGMLQINNQTENLGAVRDVMISSNQIPNIGAGVSDDDFFHLTCHIEPNLFHRIEKGEFVELEKLLPKDKIGKSSNENR